VNVLRWAIHGRSPRDVGPSVDLPSKIERFGPAARVLPRRCDLASVGGAEPSFMNCVEKPAPMRERAAVGCRTWACPFAHHKARPLRSKKRAATSYHPTRIGWAGKIARHSAYDSRMFGAASNRRPGETTSVRNSSPVARATRHAVPVETLFDHSSPGNGECSDEQEKPRRSPE